MRYVQYHPHDPSVIPLAHVLYPWLFDRGYFPESIEVRYYLLEYLRETFGYSGRLQNDTSGKPMPVSIGANILYWSISHSNEYVCYIVSNEPTGIDIAEYDERDVSVLDLHRACEYALIGKKDWKNFYILWTAKEAIIKITGSTLDDMKDMVLMQVLFDGISLIAFRGETYRIQTTFLDAAVISYTI